MKPLLRDDGTIHLHGSFDIPANLRGKHRERLFSYLNDRAEEVGGYVTVDDKDNIEVHPSTATETYYLLYDDDDELEAIAAWEGDDVWAWDIDEL